ncbi:MAG TPA: hypothetical protein VD978_20360 [Azospirillum sp.]|nr:hypothetical protein [Azospirillum sp.]
MKRVIELEQRAERVRGVALRLGHHPVGAATADSMALGVLANAAGVALDLEPGGVDFRRVVAAQARVRLAQRIRAEFAAAEPDENTTWN